MHRNKWIFTNLSKCSTSRYCFHRNYDLFICLILKGICTGEWLLSFLYTSCFLQTPSTQSRNRIVCLLLDVAVNIWLRKYMFTVEGLSADFPVTVKHHNHHFLLLLLYVHLFCLKNLARLLVISTLKIWHSQFACNFWRLFPGQLK